MFAFWNCCGGVSGKIATVEYIIAKHKPLILFISEAEYMNKMKWVNIPEYDLLSTKTEIFGKCRQIAFVKKGSGFKSLEKIPIEDDLEIICMENHLVRVAGVYRPFKLVNGNTPYSYLEKMVSTISKIAKTRKPVIIGGDFNINYNLESREKEILENVALENDLVQLVKTNTWSRIINLNGNTVDRTSKLDLIFTNDPKKISVCVEDNYTSDHSLILVNHATRIEIIREKIVRRDWRYYHPNAVCDHFNELQLKNGNEWETCNDPDMATNAVTETLEKVLDNLCPNRVIRLNRTNDVTDQALEKLKKKRKRMRKKYNKEPDDHLASTIHQMNKDIKRRIHGIKQKQLNTRLCGKSPKSFWKAVADLEGKNTRSDIELEINNELTTDGSILAEAFADFFSSKVETLSNGAGIDNYSIGPSNLHITTDEIIKAAKTLKPKLCCGEDGISMRMVKDFALNSPETIRILFNIIAKNKLPSRWKTAVVTPLFKAGDKTKVSQYRPISNLDSLGKLFEKIVLLRLDEYGELDGDFQHGFKAQRSTTTAMLEIQDFVASELDKGNIVGTYSLDLSAAFDLLRPEIFYDMLKTVISPDLLCFIMDFLSGRRFCVEVSGKRSVPRPLRVGCVQGSIMGPRLFTLYLRELAQKLPNAHITSYADDTYVSVSAKTINEVKEKLVHNMSAHNNFLRNIGMVTNVSKTELIYFSRKEIIKDPIIVDNMTINPGEHLKVLGVVFSHNLTWDKQVNNIVTKAKLVLSKLRFLTKFLNKKEMLKVATSHLFGMTYYGSQTWLTELTTFNQWKKLNAIHYRALRICLKDFKNKISKAQLNAELKRATPLQWMKFSNTKLAINLALMGDRTTRLGRRLQGCMYINDRCPGRGITMDTSRLKIGRNSFLNRLNCLREVNFDWTTGICPHRLRVELKKTFIK